MHGEGKNNQRESRLPGSAAGNTYLHGKYVLLEKCMQFRRHEDLTSGRSHSLASGADTAVPWYHRPSDRVAE